MARQHRPPVRTGAAARSDAGPQIAQMQTPASRGRVASWPGQESAEPDCPDHFARGHRPAWSRVEEERQAWHGGDRLPEPRSFVGDQELPRSSLKHPATPARGPQAWHRSSALTGLSWSGADPAASRFFCKLLRGQPRFVQSTFLIPAGELGGPDLQVGPEQIAEGADLLLGIELGA